MNEFNKIIRAHFGALTNEEINILRSYFYEEKLSKGEYFTRTGKYCKKLSLIKSGFLRIYRLSDEKEITQWISTPNYLVTEISSFFFDQPSRLNIQALTDVELLTLNKTNYSELIKKLPKWKEIEMQYIAKCFAVIEDRVFSHLSMSAEERYDIYYHQNQELFNQVPLQHIASILGMSAETFSRIRKRKTENS